MRMEVEFTLPDGVTNMAECFLRLGIRIKQLATEGTAKVSPDEPLVDAFKGDLTIRNWSLGEV